MKKEAYIVKTTNDLPMRISISKSGFAPILFLEWVASFKDREKILHRIDDKKNFGRFLVQITNANETTCQQCVDYINANC